MKPLTVVGSNTGINIENFAEILAIKKVCEVSAGYTGANLSFNTLETIEEIIKTQDLLSLSGSPAIVGEPSLHLYDEDAWLVLGALNVVASLNSDKHLALSAQLLLDDFGRNSVSQ